MRVPSIRQTKGGQLQQYRLYFFDHDGRIASAPYEFQADGDATALRLAQGWREGRKLELWSGTRKVRCWGFSRCPNPLCD